MNNIPIAEEFLKSKGKTQFDTHGNVYPKRLCIKYMIEFAKLHVEACKKEYLQHGFGRYMQHAFDKNPVRIPIDEDSILNVYPLTNIK